MGMNKPEDVKKIVKREVEAILKREGILPPKAYVTTEIITRLKTLTSWEGRPTHERMGVSIRRVVEEVIEEMGLPKRRNPSEPPCLDPEENAVDVDWQNPEEAAVYTQRFIAPASRRNKLSRAV